MKHNRTHLMLFLLLSTVTFLLATHRDALAAEAALDYRVSALLNVSLTYVGQVGATAADHSVKRRLEYRF